MHRHDFNQQKKLSSQFYHYRNKVKGLEKLTVTELKSQLRKLEHNKLIYRDF